jgi:hypothetical protein
MPSALCVAQKKAPPPGTGRAARSAPSSEAPWAPQPERVGGILGVDDRPRFRDDVVRERRHARRYRLREEMRVGTVLPEQGVTFYAVPPEYHVNLAYQYAFVNDEMILVDPYSRRVVEVID